MARIGPDGFSRLVADIAEGSEGFDVMGTACLVRPFKKAVMSGAQLMPYPRYPARLFACDHEHVEWWCGQDSIG